MLRLINFLLINNLLNKKNYKKIMFLIILTNIYLKNYYNYLYIINYFKNIHYDSYLPFDETYNELNNNNLSNNTLEDKVLIEKDNTALNTKNMCIEHQTELYPISNDNPLIINSYEPINYLTQNLEKKLFSISVDSKNDSLPLLSNVKKENLIYETKNSISKSDDKPYFNLIHSNKSISRLKNNAIKIDPFKNIYDFTSTIHQISISDHIKKSELKNKIEFNCKINNIIDTTLNKDIYVPMLLSNCVLIDFFQGDLKFSSPIKDITNISNMIYLTDSTLIIDNSIHKEQGSLFLDGYLKTSFDSLKPLNHNTNILTSTYRNNILCTPFSISQLIDLNYPISNIPIAFNNLQIDIITTSSNTKRILKKPSYIKQCENLYNDCELIIDLTYEICIYKNENISI